MKGIRETLAEKKGWREIKKASYTAYGVYDKDIEAMYTLAREVYLHLAAEGRPNPFKFFSKAVHALADTVRGINLPDASVYDRWVSLNVHGTSMMAGTAETALLAIQQAIKVANDIPKSVLAAHPHLLNSATFLAHTALCVAAEEWTKEGYALKVGAV